MSDIVFAENELRCCEFCRWFRMEDEAYGEGFCRKNKVDVTEGLYCKRFTAR